MVDTLKHMKESAQIAAVRNFNRRYARHVGVVDGKILPKGFSLAELHVMHSIAHKPGITAKELAATLHLDHGYLSRLLASLDKRRLISRTQNLKDKRQLHLELSANGKKRFSEIEEFANAHVGQSLTTMPEVKREAMIRSMDTILRTLNEDPSAPLVFRQLKLGDAGWIAHRHGAMIAPEFGWDERFEALCARILADFIDNYQPAWERSFIAERNGDILGSIFLVKQNEETAKLRLLYVEPAARGLGLATKLLEKSITFARSKHYKRVSLFTTSNNQGARRIYQKLGFTLVKEEPNDQFGQNLIGETWELSL